MDESTKSERARDGVTRDDHVTRALRETDSPDNDRAASWAAGVWDFVVMPFTGVPVTKTGFYVLLFVVVLVPLGLVLANTAGWI